MSWSRSSSTRLSLVSTGLLLVEGVDSSQCSWLIHAVPRRLQFLQMESSVVAKMQRTLRRLHSQQLCVPLRTFLRLASGSSICGLASAIVDCDCLARVISRHFRCNSDE